MSLYDASIIRAIEANALRDIAEAEDARFFSLIQAAAGVAQLRRYRPRSARAGSLRRRAPDLDRLIHRRIEAAVNAGFYHQDSLDEAIKGLGWIVEFSRTYHLTGNLHDTFSYTVQTNREDAPTTGIDWVTGTPVPLRPLPHRIRGHFLMRRA